MSKKIPANDLQTMRSEGKTSSPPQGQKSEEQSSEQYNDLVLALSHYNPRPVNRVARNVEDRVSRLKAIGNGQVPLCMAYAFSKLSEGIIE